ncbi:glycosyltransferase family 4 protein [Nocardia sp. BMG51109]|uniref:glycosyltransferase family 4 protein n=1 Tax=Nocardia sp. BMG51109 TaxID=1056816 RepID=UPI000463E144|nr:glycosyltransferase family 4 protein [Nocardia sp. BMG51109]
MTVRIGIHFLRHRLLRAAEKYGGQAAYSSVFRCSRGFDAIGAAPTGRDGGEDTTFEDTALEDTAFEIWDEHETADEFVGRVDVLVGIPDIRLMNARARARHRPPYLALVMGDATRAVPWRAAFMRQFQSNDTLVCSCSADRDILRMFLDTPWQSSVDVAPMPTELEGIAPTGQAPTVVAEALAGVDPRRPIILSAERMNSEKGIHHVIPLVAYLRDHGHDPMVVFLNGGADAAKTAYQAELEAQLAATRLTDSAVFLPFLPTHEVAAAYARAALVTSASTIYDNNFGYIPIEAQATSTPPIVTDWGGYRDSVLDGKTGLFMPTTLQTDGSVRVDWLPAARAAADVLSDPERYDRMARAGRQHVQDRFSIQAARRIYSELAVTALERNIDAAPPWRINELGQTAIDVGWTDQTDTPDRTGRRAWRASHHSADHAALHQLIYGKYATCSEGSDPP